MDIISVVIPCYQQAQFLSEAIASAVHQSYPRVEVIVVDDGSPDPVFEIATRYPGVRYIRHKKNQGLAAARNTGLASSIGAYLVFLDADDRLVPQALEHGYACFRAHPDCGFVYGNYSCINQDGIPVPRTLSTYQPADMFGALLQANIIGMHATVMYRRAVFDVVGPFDTSLRAAEDYDLYLRIARTFPIRFHSHVVAEYRRHGSNLSSDPALMLRSVLAVLRAQHPYVKRYPQYLSAYRQGIGNARRKYGESLFWQISAEFRLQGMRKRALRNVALLAWHDPGRLVSHAGRKMLNVLCKVVPRPQT